MWQTNKIGKIWCMEPLHSFNNGNSLSELPAIMHGNLTVGRCWQRKYTLLLFCCIWDGYMQGLKTSLITIGIKNLALCLVDTMSVQLNPGLNTEQREGKM